MPRGASEIADLRLVRLQKLITRFMTAPNLVLKKLFGTQNDASDTIKWESQIGNRGMTPFGASGAPSPTVAPNGLAQHQAKAAVWKEKMYLDEEFLNNLRQPGTTATYWTAKARIARESFMMRNRCDRREEWMFCKMITAGSFTYNDMKGVMISVDYGIPTANKVSLAANRHWDTGTARNVLEDIMDGKIFLSKECGAKINYALFTSEILKLLVLDSAIQGLLKRSAYGLGNLFASPVPVLATLLDIDNMVLYDEQFELTAWLTAVVTADSTTVVSVDNSSDFEVDGTLRFYDVSADTYEDETISAVDEDLGTITVSTAPSTSYKSGEDKVLMRKRFLPEDKFTMFASTVDGIPIADMRYAPYGYPTRGWGLRIDKKEEWDPDGVWVRVRNKGLPVLYNKDAVYILTVKD